VYVKLLKMMHKRHQNVQSENLKKVLLIVGNKYILKKMTHGGNNIKIHNPCSMT
jgi:hypothetical protein